MSDNKKLVNKILESSKKIHEASLSGGGNFMILSSHIFNMINGLNKSKKDIRKEKIKKIFDEET